MVKIHQTVVYGLFNIALTQITMERSSKFAHTTRYAITPRMVWNGVLVVQTRQPTHFTTKVDSLNKKFIDFHHFIVQLLRHFLESTRNIVIFVNHNIKCRKHGCSIHNLPKWIQCSICVLFSYSAAHKFIQTDEDGHIYYFQIPRIIKYYREMSLVGWTLQIEWKPHW